MITDSRITDYINSLDPGDGELCDRIAREAVRSGVPIVAAETAALIKSHARFKEAGADPGGGNGCGLFGSFNGPVHAGNGTLPP